MRKCLQILGVILLVNVVMFIFFSDDFYGDKTIISFSVLYTLCLPFVVLVITYAMVRLFKVERKYKLGIFIISAIIYVGIPKGIRFVADDVLEHYYHTTSYNNLLGFSSYSEQTGNLWRIKCSAFKEGIVGGRITQGLSSAFDCETMREVLPTYYEEVIYTIDFRVVFIYDWRTKEITNIKNLEEFHQECINKLKIDELKSGEKVVTSPKTVGLWQEKRMLKDFYLLPQNSQFRLVERK